MSIFSKKISKKSFIVNLSAVLLCCGVVFGFWAWINAVASPKVEFTADVIVSLTGIDDGDLYIANTSVCDEISISGASLVVSDIPAGSDFILKTSSHNNALKLTPSGNVLGLTFNSSHLSSGNISQWTLNADSGTTVAHIVGASLANTWYAIKADNVLFNSFQSNASGEVSFTYNGNFSSKVFTIEQDNTAPTEFSLVSPVDGYYASNNKPSFSWNTCTDPDFSYYQLYIDDVLNIDNISSTSAEVTSAMSCGSHTWYVKTIDKAGNATQSDSTFTIDIACGTAVVISAPSPAPTQTDVPQDTEQEQESEQKIQYKGQEDKQEYIRAIRTMTVIQVKQEIVSILEKVIYLYGQLITILKK